jgi:hypothetical protein
MDIWLCHHHAEY